MKRILTCILLFMSAHVLLGQVDYDYEIDLSYKDEVKETIDNIDFLFTVDCSQGDYKKARLIIRVDNDANSDMIIFPKSYKDAKDKEKRLKEHKPPIKLNKTQKDNWGFNLQYCEDLDSNDIVVVKHDEDKKPILSKKDFEYGKEIPCTLTYYWANGDKKKYVISSNAKEVSFVIKTGPSYESFAQKVDSLHTAINETVLCIDERHQPNLEEQRKVWEEKRTQLKNEIHEIVGNLYRNDCRKPKFKELEESLSNIKFKEGRCDLHPVPPCKAKPGYCCKHPNHKCGKCCEHDGYECQNCYRKCVTDPGYCCKHPNHRCGGCCTHVGFKCQNPGCKPKPINKCEEDWGYCCKHHPKHRCGKCCQHQGYKCPDPRCNPNPPCCSLSKYTKQQVTKELRDICEKKMKITSNDCSKANRLVEHARHKDFLDQNINRYFNSIKKYCK